MKISRLVRAVTLLVIAAVLPFTMATEKTPLKVFILAGQSNMEGHAEIRTLTTSAKILPQPPC